MAALFDPVPLRNYRYVSPPRSLLEALYLERFWEMVASLYPTWLAPNVITLVGFTFMWSAFLSLLWVSPNLNGEAPGWWLLIAAVCGFTYQTLDGTDGKQARRLKCGSALGELFDHGCDAITTTMYASFCIEILEVNLDSTVGALFILHAQAAFFFSNLTLIHFERQDIQLLDSQEMQALIQGAAITRLINPAIIFSIAPLPLYLMRFIYSLPSGYLQLPVGCVQPEGVQIRAMLVFIGLLTPLTHGVLTSFRIINFYCTGAYQKKGDGNVSQHQGAVGGYTPGRGISGFFRQACTFSLWYTAALSVHALLVHMKVGTPSLLAWLLVSGLGFGDLMNRTLLQRVAHTKLLRTPLDLAGLVGMILIASLALAKDRGRILSQELLLPGFFGIALVTAVLYLRFAVEAGDAVCQVLNVSWFLVPHQKQASIKRR